jgi:rubrerythrin
MLDLEALLAIAIESERKAADNYQKAADKTNIFLLKDKFLFLKNEELGHRKLLERLFATKFPEKEPISPEGLHKPFEDFTVTDDMQLSEVIKGAMQQEQTAADFYRDIEKRLEGDKQKAMARYLASMEDSHYYLLKSELEIAFNFELYDEVHHMMHVGP